MKAFDIKYSLTLVMLIFSTTIVGQVVGWNPFFSPLENNSTSFRVDSAGQVTFIPGKTSYRLNMGTAFATTFRGDGVFSSYVSPEFTHNISKRFRLTGGVAITSTFGSSTMEYPIARYPGYYPGTRTTVYASGQYLINNKLMLTGTVYKDFPVSDAVTDPRYRARERQGMILDFGYRPVKNMQINAIIQVNQGGWDPWGYPMSHPYNFHDPFRGGYW